MFPLTGIASFCSTTGGLIILVDIFNFNEKLCGLISSLIAVPVTFVIMRYILKGDKTINKLKEEWFSFFFSKKNKSVIINLRRTYEKN